MKKILLLLAAVGSLFSASAQALLPEQTLGFNASNDAYLSDVGKPATQTSTASSNSNSVGFSNHFQRLFYTLSLVKMYYVENVDESKIVDDAIRGMLEKLDPHSVYIPAKEVEKSLESLNGSFSGIGVQFQMLKDTLFVIQAISGGPSEKVGVLPGDRIIEANDTSIVAMPSSDIQKRLRGPKGTHVKIKVVRHGVKEPLIFNITRDKIPLYSVEAAFMATPSVGYIRISNFSATTFQQFSDSMKVLKSRGAKNFIIDLQGNGGGYLVQARDMADQFLATAGQQIVYTKGEHTKPSDYQATKGGLFTEGKLIILVDENTASAAEIVSGAVQDWDRGLIVGRRTFGKGLVQQPLNIMPDMSQLRLTIARYYTPSGRCIQRPYLGGSDNYRKDIVDRYNRGELTSEDKIHFPDSLKFYTKNLHRAVYGGGGIMPDVFVPLDTNRMTSYQRKLMNMGVFNKYVTEYSDRHRAELDSKYVKAKKGGFSAFDADFKFTDADLKEVADAGATAGVAFDSTAFEDSKERMGYYLKMLLARNLWDTNEFFKLWVRKDPTYLKAIELMEDKAEYDRYLHLSREMEDAKADKK
ncbi:MAG: S41 family peptidase [Paludibacteraceae bacterium]|nr:S41 family peptidase [Paludibacteraceae bacterium]